MIDKELRAPSYLDAINANKLSEQEVAKSFVPPLNFFETLSSRNNHLLVGPRGSGKTTLLKMLTIPALANWNSSNSETVMPSVSFVGIFVAADKSWGSQLKSAQCSEALANHIAISAFTTHVLRAVCATFSQVINASDMSASPLNVELPSLPPSGEADLVDMLAEGWSLKPPIKSLQGIIVALRKRLLNLNSLRANPELTTGELPDYLTFDFLDCISLAIDSFEAISQTSGISWALLFDEFEIAPKDLQRQVIDALRGAADQRILYKVALVPHAEEVLSGSSETAPSPKHDYEIVDLWYSRKERSYEFSEALLIRKAAEHGIENLDPRKIFGRSKFSFPEGEEAPQYERDGYLYRAFENLKSKDESFTKYLEDRGIDLEKWSNLEEFERAEIRKIRTIVVMRDHFRGSEDLRTGKPRTRSRKIDSIYTEFPTILALCEGNPRQLIAIMNPLLGQLAFERQARPKAKISVTKQALEVRKAITAYRAFLRTIPVHNPNSNSHRGLLKILDEIGSFFYRASIIDPFAAQPPLSFTVDSNTDPNLLEALGHALNNGAIIYVPDKDGEPLVRSLRGKRFRLNYLLSAYYKLPLILNRSISLSSALSGESENTADLFGETGGLGK